MAKKKYNKRDYSKKNLGLAIQALRKNIIEKAFKSCEPQKINGKVWIFPKKHKGGDTMDDAAAEKQYQTLDIIRLYLERLELLSQEERKWISRSMDWLSTPIVYIKKGETT